jgi:hypothetical protein
MNNGQKSGDPMILKTFGLLSLFVIVGGAIIVFLGSIYTPSNRGKWD